MSSALFIEKNKPEYWEEMIHSYPRGLEGILKLTTVIVSNLKWIDDQSLTMFIVYPTARLCMHMCTHVCECGCMKLPQCPYGG